MGVNEQHPVGSGFTAASTATEVMAGIDLTGRTVLVTGGYSGLGRETTIALATAGARVLVPARRADAARAALAGIAGVTVLDDVDLADLASVARVSDHLIDTVDGIDLVIAAAGVMATPRRPVGPGWDYQLAVNHFGHFALIARLFPLLAARGARVVVYSSAGHHASDIRWDDLHLLAGYDKWAAYGQSKTANVLFAVHLDQLGRGEGVRAFALHPGKIMTGLQRELPVSEQVALGWIDQTGTVVGEDFKTPSQGASTGLWAATSPLLDGAGGLYLEDCDIARLATPTGTMDDGGVQPYALDDEAATQLWRITAAATATGVVR
ncbi:MAG: oxidoreductase [Nocardioides sp.]|uniref:oxidoreductase n=1 Tax=Nocardioides sp. TaxID=35761 RepID=UPI0039E34DCF